ncbi:MAG: hypothetical protein KDI39_06085 [Pseudomonadales bacterium]|nr:hypothetical protein [Pseudomonadales bacterium]
MSTENAKSLKRQWHIVRYLLKGIYVSSTEVKAHLAELGIEVDIRTIQRDLKTLQVVFPLECRQDSMPHSWRWQRAEDTNIGNINLAQALTLRLVQEQLGDILSPKLLLQLEPLFEKAKVVAGMTVDEIEQLPRQGFIKNPMERSITGHQPSPFGFVIGAVANLFEKNNHKSQEKAALVELMNVLREEELDELMCDF